MQRFRRFEYERKRGIVWVCDVVQSSKYLNSNETVDDIEAYLPRLYWVSTNIVNAFGGKFIKWTGDGFLAWFETPLDRNKIEQAEIVYKAAWHLSFLNNVTQLALSPKKKFKIRHGISYEKDALLIKIYKDQEKFDLDLIGRAVVLAFRLSGIKTDFPGIVTEREIVSNKSDYGVFKQWEPNETDIFKYFKGEEHGVDSIYVSTEKKFEKLDLPSLTEKTNKTLEDLRNPVNKDETEHISNFIELMKDGPEWCQEIIDLETKFITEQLVESLEKVSQLLERNK